MVLSPSLTTFQFYSTTLEQGWREDSNRNHAAESIAEALDINLVLAEEIEQWIKYQWYEAEKDYQDSFAQDFYNKNGRYPKNLPCMKAIERSGYGRDFVIYRQRVNTIHSSESSRFKYTVKVK